MSDDLNDLPDVPDAPEPASSAVANLDDEQALAQIGRRTGWFGRITAVLIVGGAGALAFFYYQRSQLYEEQSRAYNCLQGRVEGCEPAASEAEFLAEVRRMLSEGVADNELRSEMIMELGEHRDAAAVPLLVPFLDTAGLMRADAARALARIGSPDADAAKPDLLRVLPSCDERDRTPVVWALAVLNESSAADAIVEEFALGHLSGQEGFDPRIISNVLGASRLAGLTEHENPGVRTLVAQALSEIGTTDVVDPLTELLDDENDEVRSQAAEGLGRIGDPRAAAPLFAAMSANPSMRVVVNGALRRSTGARGLAVLLASATDETSQLELVTMLHNTHDPAAADALAGQLGHTNELIRIEAAHGLADLGDARAVPVLLALSRTTLETARDALDHLKLVTSPEVAPALIPMLEGDEWLGRRAGVLRALGRTGDASAARALMGHLEGDDMASAALALAELGSDEAFTTLLRMIPRPRDEDWANYDGMCGVVHEPELNIRTGAIRAIGRYGRAEESAVETLVTVVEDPQDDVRLRAEAGTALGALADDAVLEMLIGKIQQTDLDETARRFYLNALWQHPSRALAGRLLDLIENPATPPDVRRPAAIAVGYTGDPANDARLIAMLAGDMRRDAAFAILLGGSDEAAEALGERLATDADLRDALQQALVHAETDWFHLIRTDTWDSGEVHRRLRVARILNELEGDARFGLPWTETMTRLAGGFDGHLGLSPSQIRQRIYGDLTGEDAEVRQLAAEVLGAMNELGLLMAARDAGGNGADEARAKLMEINRAGD